MGKEKAYSEYGGKRTENMWNSVIIFVGFDLDPKKDNRKDSVSYK